MVIFLNGSINSGKSTIAKLLAKKLPRAALIEIDDLRKMITCVSLEESIPLNLENTILLIKNYIKNGFNVIVPYPLSQKNYEYFLKNLNIPDTEIKIFTLSPKREKALTNRGTRDLTDWEINRIKYHYEIGINKPDFGEIIDNTDHAPEETLKIILSKIWQQ